MSWALIRKCWMCGALLFFASADRDLCAKCEPYRQAWLCPCGHWQADGLHCECCGREPPWGCDCGWCEDVRAECYERDEWLGMWEDYPGEFLTGEMEEVPGVLD